MARSSYIYLALARSGAPVGTFTVKHELVSWLKREETWVYAVRRMPDGRRGVVAMRGTDISNDPEICGYLSREP